MYRHSKRGHWGVAGLLWERDGKRGYQFSDGKMRVFKEGYYHLLEDAQAPGDGSAKAVRRLTRLARADSVTESTRLPTLRDQILLFRRNFPEGFSGKAWMKKYRGLDARKRLKRHRDPAISDAHRLSVDKLEPLIEARDWDEIFDRLLALATGSNLVPSSHVKKLRKIRPSRDLSVAIYDWLKSDMDDDDTERRFNVLVRYLGDAATWPIVSMIGGLVDPEHHTCVRPSVYTEQGTMLLPNFKAVRRPRFKNYARYLHMAKTVSDELEAAGLPPRDLLDVYDFIWETLRKAAREDLLAQYELPPPEVVNATDEAAEQAEAA
ncbi:hypothetical protein [Enhygromyxa salina]|uniref:hypothetical protein n=1 Tax=Enhygromyxa salina TaxID=215803 RepID=UPI0011B2890B|nr:hypothetical protein [Enhygromyxa salina]